MSKRDATQLGAEEEKEERGAKQPRCSEAAKDVTTAAAASSCSGCDWLVSAPSDCGFLIVGVDVFSTDSTLTQARTRQAVSAARRDGSLTERMQTACALLKADGERVESLLDMSLHVDEGEDEPVCAFFHLLWLFAETTIRMSDYAATIERKRVARQLFKETLVPLLPRLLSSFDPAITDAVTGNNALHALLPYMTPGPPGSFSYQLTEALIQHGVDIHQRNKGGHTAALSHALGLHWASPSSCILRLLLQYGADLNASDAEGDTALHILIDNEAWYVLKELCAPPPEKNLPCVDHLDLFVRNHAGRGPVETSRGMPRWLASQANLEIRCILQAMLDKWHSHTRLTVLAALSEPLIPDLAKLVLGYVDGSELASKAKSASHRLLLSSRLVAASSAF